MYVYKPYKQLSTDFNQFSLKLYLSEQNTLDVWDEILV